MPDIALVEAQYNNILNQTPLVLFPIRLETRIVGQELWVRIYPDLIHQDSHVRTLSANELQWGKSYWEALWRAGTASGDEPKHLLAWRQLSERVGPQRAAWIARECRPTNDAVRPQLGTPSSQPLNPEPIFPELSVEPSQSVWRRAPYTKMLPDCWVAIGLNESGGEIFRVCGERIHPDPLPTGLKSTDQFDQKLLVDPDLKWMVDFREALTQGMALRIPFVTATQSLPLLLVFGLKTEMGGEDSRTRLQHLFEAHRHTWGLALTPQGAPTNNTPDAPALYRQRDQGGDRSFLDLKRPIHVDAGALATAFGLPLQSFAGVPNSDLRDQEPAVLMLEALWYGAFDYYLTFMLDKSMAEKNLDEWRDFVLGHVRARGPLPTLRVSNQPYGVLPVTALQHWQSPNPQMPDGAIAGWIDLLRSLRDLWRRYIPHVPTVIPPSSAVASTDRDQRLIDIFTAEALSKRYRGRSLYGPSYIDNFWWLVKPDLPPDWRIKLVSKSSPLLAERGVGDVEQNRLTNSVLGIQHFDINLPFVTNQALSESEPMPPDINGNYILWLAQASPEDIYNRDEPFLLYKLLRHSVLLAFVHAAAAYELEQNPIEPNVTLYKRNRIGEPELIDLNFWVIGEDQPSLTLWRFLHDAPHHRDLKLMELLADPSTPSSAIDLLRRFLSELEALSQTPTASLERVLAETLDLLSYRVDAWITACATYRLNQNRAKQAFDGNIQSVIGGFGWVENLAPRPSATALTEGYLHAPSIAHGVTASVLRSGYLVHNEAGKSGPLAVNLSSQRVHAAIALLDGVRNGQSLGALLGYRVERRLRKEQLETNIALLRQDYPLVAGKLNPTPDNQTPLDTVAAQNVVDGLALLRAWQRAPSVLAPYPSREALNLILQEVESLCDAVNDLGMAESVFQIVQGGNPARAGSALDAIARGETPPAEFDFVRTPRTGVGIKHRLLVLFPAQAPANPTGWTVRPRGEAEPYLNAWAAALFGDPSNVSCAARFLPVDEAEVDLIQPLTIRLSNLGLCPLDIIAWPDLNEQASQTILEQYIAAYAYRQYATVRQSGQPEVPRLKLNFERPADDQDLKHLTFRDLMALARALRDLLQSSRPATSEDLESTTKIVDDGLATRATAAIQELSRRHETLKGCVVFDETDKSWKVAEGKTLDDLRAALFALVSFNLANAAPRVLAGSDAEAGAALIRQSVELMQESKATIERCGGQPAQKQLEILFGEGFNALSKFAITYPNNNTLQAAIDKVSGVADQPLSTVVPWFQRIARVRAHVARFDQLLISVDAFGFVADPAKQANASHFQVGQLPITTTPQRWVGLALPQNGEMAGGRISLVIHAPLGLNAQATEFAGLWVDGWEEVVPNAKETTAMVFHYDGPGATPPQSILLATHPDPSATWGIDMVRDILLETLELSKIRAVDPALLGAQSQIGHILPALLFAYNRNGDTIESDFRS